MSNNFHNSERSQIHRLRPDLVFPNQLLHDMDQFVLVVFIFKLDKIHQYHTGQVP